VEFYTKKSVIMTTTIFMEWLTAPDASIRVQSRSMQLYMDDYATHLQDIPYILESNTHPVFGDLLNGKKLVCDSNPHLSFNHPMLTWQLTE
jgi:hypothetical protein